MKKLLAILLAVTMLASMVTVASAAENTTSKTTTLTTSVPAASYVLNIPEDQTIPYGQTSTEIGNVTITDSKNFAEGKNVEVTVAHSGKFTSEDVTTTIAYRVRAFYQTESNGFQSSELKNEDKLVFFGNSAQTVDEKATVKFEYKENGIDRFERVKVDTLKIQITSSDWGKALAGDYSTTITFSSEVVAQ